MLNKFLGLGKTTWREARATLQKLLSVKSEADFGENDLEEVQKLLVSAARDTYFSDLTCIIAMLLLNNKLSPIPRELTKSIADESVQRTSTSRFRKRVLPPDLTESNQPFEPTSTTNFHPISDPNISTMQRKHSKEQTHFAQASSSGLKHSHMQQKPSLKRQKIVEGKKTKGVRVDLINFGSPKEVVAQGRIMSRDPGKEVGGFKLGPYFW